MPPPLVTKSPNADLDFALDWSAWLTAGDSLSTAQWSVPAGLTKPKPSVVSGSRAVVWLGGGTLGWTYKVMCRIVTAQGRTDERELTVLIAPR